MFEKSLLAQNIQYLASKAGKKIGELEKSAGVSAGYTSRLLKSEEKTSFPIMDLALEASKQFEMPVDLLLTKRVDEVHPNELYLIEFFNKLRDDTLAGIISWTVETKEMLEQSSGQYRHPRFFPDDPQDIYTDFHYSSLFSTSNELDEKSICTLVQDHFLYIVQVKQDEKKGFEIYFSDNAKKKTSPIVCVWTDDGLFRKARELFSLASETRNQINLSYMTRKTIDSYMGKLQEPESVDDLPF